MAGRAPISSTGGRSKVKPAESAAAPTRAPTGPLNPQSQQQRQHRWLERHGALVYSGGARGRWTRGPGGQDLGPGALPPAGGGRPRGQSERGRREGPQAPGGGERPAAAHAGRGTSSCWWSGEVLDSAGPPWSPCSPFPLPAGIPPGLGGPGTLGGVPAGIPWPSPALWGPNPGTCCCAQPAAAGGRPRGRDAPSPRGGLGSWGAAWPQTALGEQQTGWCPGPAGTSPVGSVRRTGGSWPGSPTVNSGASFARRGPRSGCEFCPPPGTQLPPVTWTRPTSRWRKELGGRGAGCPSHSVCRSPGTPPATRWSWCVAPSASGSACGGAANTTWTSTCWGCWRGGRPSRAARYRSATSWWRSMGSPRWA
ncbi:PDZ domain-containing protein MAGIX isoform X3 [Lepidochelys kempii]|uniref:PDZ domain-containing protein MAGIX isoform X3 n=1 Tax=Lepidochelys kempii TaxID=8472 RepID=UPI003C7061C8